MEQIEILKQSGIISQDIYASILKINDVLNQYSFMNEEERNVFLVHIAMASLRVLKQEEIPCVGEVILTALEELAFYDLACTLLMKIEKHLCLPFPKYEKEYLLLHICNGYTNYKNCNNSN